MTAFAFERRGRTEHGHRHENHEQQHDGEHERRGALGRRLPGAGLPRGDDVVRIVGVRDHLAVLRDLAADGGELLERELLAEDELLPRGRDERRAALALIDRLERLRIVDGGDVSDVAELRAVDERERDEQHRCDERTDDDERRAAAAAARAAVADRAEQRQQEQRQNVVERHNHARPRLTHAELVRQNQGNRVVIRLPEGADQEKGKAHQNCAFIVEFHRFSSISRQMAAMSCSTHVGWMSNRSMSAHVPSPERTNTVSTPAFTPQATSV